MNLSRRSILVAAAPAIALLAALAYSAWWWYLAGTLREGVAAWAQARAAQGWTVGTGEVTVGGFPLALRLTVPEPSIADADGDSWRGPSLAATVSPFGVGRVHLSAPGRHSLVRAGAAPVPVDVIGLAADLKLDRRGVLQVTLDLRGVTTADGGFDALELVARRLGTLPPVPGDETMGIVATVVNLSVPQEWGLVLDPKLASGHIEARLMGVIAPGKPAESLATWRDAGGTVEFDAVSFDWPPLAGTGSATLALDTQMQPILAGSFALRGLPELVDRLVKANRLSASLASVFKLTLNVLSKTASDGTSEAKAPVTIQDRVLSVGPLPLAELPRIDW